MRLAFRLLPAALLLALVSCTLPPRESPAAASQASAAASSSVDSSSKLSEPADVELAGGSSSVPSDIELQERLLSGGLLQLGNPSAPVTLLLFTNYDSPYCRDFERDVLSRLIVNQVEPGAVSVITAAFPLKKYPASERNAAMVLCAARQGKGRVVSDALFQRGGATLRTKHPGFDLNVALFERCLADPTVPQMLNVQKGMAEALGVTLVPTLFLNGEKLVGLPEYADLRGRIEALLHPST